MAHKALITGIGGKEPKIDGEAFVAPTASVIGDVTLQAGDVTLEVRNALRLQDGRVVRFPRSQGLDVVGHVPDIFRLLDTVNERRHGRAHEARGQLEDPTGGNGHAASLTQRDRHGITDWRRGLAP